jgi:hypothetical protein
VIRDAGLAVVLGIRPQADVTRSHQQRLGLVKVLPLLCHLCRQDQRLQTVAVGKLRPRLDGGK